MKSNLTRGNSITENHNPYADPAEAMRITFTLMGDAIRKHMNASRPIPKYIIGRGVPIISHGEALETLIKLKLE